MTQFTNEKQHIKVVQYMHGDFEYFRWSEMINRRYSERRGYEYVVSHEIPRNDRHVCWHKIPVILNELRDCDTLIFVDADAHFYSHDLRIEEELIPLLGDKSILMSQDVVSEYERWTPDLPNTGVILTKNNKQTHLFFKAWNEASDIDESTRWTWPPEQLALWNVVLPRFPDVVQIHPDYYRIHGRYGHFIRHYSGETDAERTQKMKAFCSSRQIKEIL